MNNPVFNKLIQYLVLDDIEKLKDEDDFSKEEILAFLQESNTSSYLTSPIIGNTIITDGNLYTTLKIINDLALEQGSFVLLTSKNHEKINNYLVKRAEEIYKALSINVSLTIYIVISYNDYIDRFLTLIGNENFVLSGKKLFPYCNYIIV